MSDEQNKAFFDEFFGKFILTTFLVSFLASFLASFLTSFLTYNLLIIASFRIRVPSILSFCDNFDSGSGERRGQKISVFVHTQGMKTVVVECPLIISNLFYRNDFEKISLLRKL